MSRSESKNLSLPTVDIHHHVLPDFFWRETNEQSGPVGGIAPPPSYLRRDLAVGSRAHIARTPVLSDPERAAVLGETALTLLPRVASVLRSRLAPVSAHAPS
jgi:hypothetical protein